MRDLCQSATHQCSVPVTPIQGTLATCTQIVWTYLFELAVLHEPVNGWSVAGTVLILGFMLVVGHAKMNQRGEEREERHEVAPDESEAPLLSSAPRRMESLAPKSNET